MSVLVHSVGVSIPNGLCSSLFETKWQPPLQLASALGLLDGPVHGDNVE